MKEESMKLSELMKVIDRWADIEVYEYKNGHNGRYEVFYNGPALAMIDMIDADVDKVYNGGLDNVISIRIKNTNPWICTDVDECQYQRKISDDLYEMYGVIDIGGWYMVNHKLLRISNLERNKGFVTALLTSYGYDGDGEWRDVLKSHGVTPEMCEPLLVEMAFETTPMDDDVPGYRHLSDAMHEVLKAVAE